MSYFRDVLHFHMNCLPGHIRRLPGWPPYEIGTAKTALISEEIEELNQAIKDGDLAGAADAIGDSVYVLMGLGVALGIDMDRVWSAIQAANMTKSEGPISPELKLLKPPGFKPPDIQFVLDTQVPLLGDDALAAWIARFERRRNPQ